MYSRNYQSGESVPPNYKGNAFDTPECTGNTVSCESRCEERAESGCSANGEGAGVLAGLCARRDGKGLELDDLILAGLIILLLNSHADDELLIILVLLFLCGF